MSVDTQTNRISAERGRGMQLQAGRIGRLVSETFTRRRLAITAAQAAILVGFLGLWEFVSGPPGAPHTLIDEFYVSTPSAIWEALRNWIESGLLWSSTLVTLQETIIGFFIGVALGLVFGFVLGVNRTLSEIFNPFVNALYSIPRLALVPLFILWFGVGIESKLALVASVVSFLVFYATYAGVNDVDHHLVDKMRLMGASSWQVHQKATLPSAMTFIIQGLNISAPYALVVAVTAEMLASNRGLGYLLVSSSGQFYTAGVFAAMFVMMLLGILMMGFVTLLERRLLRWKPRRMAGQR